eukprot:6490419-Prymnesium_polylepis.2
MVTRPATETDRLPVVFSRCTALSVTAEMTAMSLSLSSASGGTPSLRICVAGGRKERCGRRGVRARAWRGCRGAFWATPGRVMCGVCLDARWGHSRGGGRACGAPGQAR